MLKHLLATWKLTTLELRSLIQFKCGRQSSSKEPKRVLMTREPVAVSQVSQVVLSPSRDSQLRELRAHACSLLLWPEFAKFSGCARSQGTVLTFSLPYMGPQVTWLLAQVGRTKSAWKQPLGVSLALCTFLTAARELWQKAAHSDLLLCKLPWWVGVCFLYPHFLGCSQLFSGVQALKRSPNV